MKKNTTIIGITLLSFVVLIFGLSGKFTHEKFDSEKY
jgi:hypothetical protein